MRRELNDGHAPHSRRRHDPSELPANRVDLRAGQVV